MSRVKSLIVAATAIALTVCLLLESPAQEAKPRPGRLTPEERDALRPGVLVEFSSPASPSEVVDYGDVRLPALFVAAGTSPSPLLPAGSFRATISGYLKLPLRGEYRFSLEGRGAAKLLFNDVVVADFPQGDLAAPPVNVELVKGYNKFQLEYSSPPDGDSKLRVIWESDEFPAEPVSPELWSFDGRHAGWLQGASLRTGRQLFAERQCSKCHTLPNGMEEQIAESPQAMPELASAAPSLVAAGQRFDPMWLRQWIADPSSLRNRTTMPRVLAHLDAKAQSQHAADLAAFLLEQNDAAFKPLAPDAGDGRASADDETIARGEALFEDRGCIACHRFTPASEADEFNRVSLFFVGQKYQAGALAAFLMDSHRYYPWNRMPKFALEPAEAEALAGFLRKTGAGKLPPVAAAPRANADHGRTLFVETGCANCHEVKPRDGAALVARERIAMKNVERGCLAAEVGVAGFAPQFGFDEPQRAALTDFLATDLTSLARETPAEFSRRQFDAIGCKACHSRDGVEADLPYILAEFGQLGHAPEPIPDLTWTGEKLRPDWTVMQFLGELTYRPRPHFHARMPAFPTRAKLLAAGLSHEHGYAADEDPRPKFDADVAKTGEEVAAMNTGLACHRCHAIGDKEAEAPFEARSTNLSVASERLRYPFYHRWMRDPLRIDPQTKMIKFAQDGKKTGLTTIYDGDGQRQFDAVWHYLQTLAEKPPSQ